MPILKRIEVLRVFVLVLPFKAFQVKTIYLIGCIKRDVVRWIQKYSPQGNIDLSSWCCGLTHYKDFRAVEKMLAEKGVTDVYYRHWFANDIGAAQEIIGFYVKNGMKTKPVKGGYKSGARYFYIFRADIKSPDDIFSLLS